MRSFRLAAALVALGLSQAACQKGEQTRDQAAAEPAGPVKGVTRDNAGKAAPDVELHDGDDKPSSLATARGRPVLVNIWATWCAPCVKELPTLQAISRRRGSPRIIAVSQDMAPRSSVDAFLDQHELDDLEVWQDPKMELASAAGAEVLPTTILFDSEGREMWRYVGDLDWTSEEAAKLLADAQPAKER
jgi:thiol-disulfide isomerase/thioredoxin